MYIKLAKAGLSAVAILAISASRLTSQPPTSPVKPVSMINTSIDIQVDVHEEHIEGRDGYLIVYLSPQTSDGTQIQRWEWSGKNQDEPSYPQGEIAVVSKEGVTRSLTVTAVDERGHKSCPYLVTLFPSPASKLLSKPTACE